MNSCLRHRGLASPQFASPGAPHLGAILQPEKSGDVIAMILTLLDVQVFFNKSCFSLRRAASKLKLLLDSNRMITFPIQSEDFLAIAH